MTWLLDNVPQHDNGFVHKGIQYPPNWIRNAQPASRLAVGITEAPEEKPFDERFSFGWDASNSAIWRDVAAVKAEFKALQTETANRFLSTSDWRVIKAQETSGTVESSWTTYRAAVRTACNTRQTEIDSAASTEALQTLIEVTGLTSWPDAPTS